MYLICCALQTASGVLCAVEWDICSLTKRTKHKVLLREIELNSYFGLTGPWSVECAAHTQSQSAPSAVANVAITFAKTFTDTLRIVLEESRRHNSTWRWRLSHKPGTVAHACDPTFWSGSLRHAWATKLDHSNHKFKRGWGCFSVIQNLLERM